MSGVAAAPATERRAGCAITRPRQLVSSSLFSSRSAIKTGNAHRLGRHRNRNRPASRRGGGGGGGYRVQRPASRRWVRRRRSHWQKGRNTLIYDDKDVLENKNRSAKETDLGGGRGGRSRHDGLVGDGDGQVGVVDERPSAGHFARLELAAERRQVRVAVETAISRLRPALVRARRRRRCKTQHDK